MNNFLKMCGNPGERIPHLYTSNS